LWSEDVPGAGHAVVFRKLHGLDHVIGGAGMVPDLNH
jgi:hypothetical protein